MERPTNGGSDRRWHPDLNPAEWERATRQSIFDSVRRCVGHAMYPELRLGMPAAELQVSDAVFRELHICTQSYARALYALGQRPENAAGLIIAAAREAAAPNALHPCVVAALEQWCREADIAA